MARANLTFSPALTNAFSAAQSGRTVRFIQVLIEGETVVAGIVGNRERNVEHDFDTLLAPIVSQLTACLFLFSISDGSTNNATAKSWILVAWVPDTCKPREKMLYSSSREDLKQVLGVTNFTSDFYANALSDLSYQNTHKIGKNDERAPLREDEILLRQLNIAEQTGLAGGRAKGMNMIPFHMTSQLTDKMTAFQANRANWVEMFIDTVRESVETPSSAAGNVTPRSTPEALTNLVHESEGRFYALRYQGHEAHASTYFIYSCPESTPIRDKMILSTAKSTVIAALADMGINFDKTVEVRCRQDLADALLPTDADDGKPTSTSMFNKPSKPGRGPSRTPTSPTSPKK